MYVQTTHYAVFSDAKVDEKMKRVKKAGMV